MEKIKVHPDLGFKLLEEANCLGEIALDVVLHQHERLTGSGYPDKLKGEAISPFVRIVSIADVFDALTTDSPHRKGHSTRDAIGIMHQSMRDDLDQDLLRMFVDIMSGSLTPGTKPTKPRAGVRLFGH
jgi:HD-GYP domain-containing protein (c-di-GMP phosphodiesterase class II)